MVAKPSLWIGVGDFGAGVVSALERECATRAPIDARTGAMFAVLASTVPDVVAGMPVLHIDVNAEGVAESLFDFALQLPVLPPGGQVQGKDLYIVAELCDLGAEPVATLVDTLVGKLNEAGLSYNQCYVLSTWKGAAESAAFVRQLNGRLAQRGGSGQVFVLERVGLRQAQMVITHREELQEAAVLFGLVRLFTAFPQDLQFLNMLGTADRSVFGGDAARLPAYATIAVRSVEYPAVTLTEYCTQYALGVWIRALNGALPDGQDATSPPAPAIVGAIDLQVLRDVALPVDSGNAVLASEGGAAVNDGREPPSILLKRPRALDPTVVVQDALDDELADFDRQVTEWVDRLPELVLKPFTLTQRGKILSEVRVYLEAREKELHGLWTDATQEHPLSEARSRLDSWKDQWRLLSASPGVLPGADQNGAGKGPWQPIPGPADVNEIREAIAGARSRLGAALKVRPNPTLVLIYAALYFVTGTALLWPTLHAAFGGDPAVMGVVAVFINVCFSVVLFTSVILRQRNRLMRVIRRQERT